MNSRKLYSRRLTRREVLERGLDRFQIWQGYFFRWSSDTKEYLLWIRLLRKTHTPTPSPTV